MPWAVHAITINHIGGRVMISLADMMDVIEDCIQYVRFMVLQGIKVRNILVSRTKKRSGWEHLHGWIVVDSSDPSSVEKFMTIYNVDSNGNFIGIEDVRLKPIQSDPDLDDTVIETNIDNVIDLKIIPDKNVYIYLDNLDNLINRSSYRVRIAF